MADVVIQRKWYTVAEVAEMLGYGLPKTKMLVITGDLRSLKDGRSRRILRNGWTSTWPSGRPRSRTSGDRQTREW